MTIVKGLGRIQIRLVKKIGHTYNSFPLTRKRISILKKTNYLCTYCGKCLDIDFHADHIFPKSLGGNSKIENLAASCPKCNMKKGNEII